MPLPRKWLILISCLLVGTFVWLMEPRFLVEPNDIFDIQVSTNSNQYNASNYIQEDSLQNHGVNHTPEDLNRDNGTDYSSEDSHQDDNAVLALEDLNQDDDANIISEDFQQDDSVVHSLGDLNQDNDANIISEDLQHDDDRIDMSEELNQDKGKHHASEKKKVDSPWGAIGTILYQPGVVKPVGEVYTKTIIVPKTREDNVEWIADNFGEDPNVRSVIYAVDDADTAFHTPMNKGHEVMAYLTFIIEHYDRLSDVNIFLHSHQYAWHNNDLLDNDAVQMIRRLSPERVQRVGYMNMRCHWGPGCPSWIHPGNLEEDINKEEETLLARAWTEIFPFDPIPKVLAQPCCAQFAISRDRIRTLPLARYIFFRAWLFRTSLSDFISGRVWEYIWQFIFTGEHVMCPAEHVCYCDGYGVCFGGEKEYRAFYHRYRQREQLEDELRVWNEMQESFAAATEEERRELRKPETGLNLELEGKIRGLRAWCDDRKQQAKDRGDMAVNRAIEAGRDWKQGDGF